MSKYDDFVKLASTLTEAEKKELTDFKKIEALLGNKIGLGDSKRERTDYITTLKTTPPRELNEMIHKAQKYECPELGKIAQSTLLITAAAVLSPEERTSALQKIAKASPATEKSALTDLASMMQKKWDEQKKLDEKNKEQNIEPDKEQNMEKIMEKVGQLMEQVIKHNPPDKTLPKYISEGIKKLFDKLTPYTDKTKAHEQKASKWTNKITAETEQKSQSFNR